MIQPKQLIAVLEQSLQEFQVNSLFASTKDGQMIAHVGQTINQLPQFSTMSILFEDCSEIAKLQIDETSQLKYLLADLADQQVVMSNYKDLFCVGMTSNQSVGLLIKYMDKLHLKLNDLIR